MFKKRNVKPYVPQKDVADTVVDGLIMFMALMLDLVLAAVVLGMFGVIK